MNALVDYIITHPGWREYSEWEGSEDTFGSY